MLWDITGRSSEDVLHRALRSRTLRRPQHPVLPRASTAWAGLPRAGLLVRHNTLLLLRDPGPLVGRLVMPVVVMLALRPLYVAAEGPAGAGQAAIGALVTFSLPALSIVGGSILSERVWHTWDRLRVAPVRPFELLVGKAVPAFGVLAAQQAVVLTAGVVFCGVTVRSPGLLGVACAAWGLALLAMGSAVGVTARSFGQLSATFDIGGFCLTNVGGAMVPLAVLPGWVRDVAPASPGYWAATTLRHASAGEAPQTLRGVAVLLAVAAASGAFAAWRIRHGWGRAEAG
ncbi:ABC transporter permease [Actinacidiphila paucisporea]|uniref:ABC-2 type transport system permease protein n=1 Tax=Actinacidiphila paucisporea TaxID=310782 RepID=A0A1M7MGM4_9ACTN|nr:ABC transporter permease [Actinacidiphila paucisporea]SHM89960.1 ABC-2 type transport system permease protein [Actinacidiphila paucisporea]